MEPLENETTNIEQQFPNNPQIGDVIDKSMISQSSLPGYEEDILARNKAISAPASIGAQDVNSLYPGLSQGIAQGNYSGSIVGSNTIYTPSGNIMALNPILSRRKAQDDAARARMEQLKPIAPPTPYQLKDARYQDKLNNKFNSEVKLLIDDAYSKYGQDANVLFKDPNSPQYRKLRELEQAYNAYGKNFDQLTTGLVKMEEDMRTNDFLYPESAKKTLRDYQRMEGQAFGEEGGFDKLEELNKMRGELMSFPTIANWMKENIQFDKYTGDITSRFVVGNGGELLTHKTVTEENFDEVKKPIVDEAVRSMWPQIENGTVTVEQITDFVDGALRNSKKITSAGVSEKRQDTQDLSKVSDIQVVDVDPTKAPKFSVLGYNQDGTQKQAGGYSYPELATTVVSGFKQVKLDSPFILNGDKDKRIPGIVPFTITGTALIEDPNGKKRIVAHGEAMVDRNGYVSSDGKTVLSKEQYEALPSNKPIKNKDGKVIEKPSGDKEDAKENYSLRTIKEPRSMTVYLEPATLEKIKQGGKQGAGKLQESHDRMVEIKEGKSKNTEPAKPKTGSNPKTVIQNGVTYTYNEKTGKYE